jgi:hypothetical protein
LASAELGWSVDTRKLYIGNGTLTEGAPTEGVTEILTQHTPILSILKNYTFAGNAGGYTTQTGSSYLNPVIRYLQDKLDEAVSVKDFGATGDGVTDDTAAINRAITQIYSASWIDIRPQTRRTIHFPAGTYKVTAGVILIPPWLRIVGDGIESSVIKQTDASQACLFQSTDSKYQTGSNLGQSSTISEFMSFENITLQTTADKDIVILDSVNNVRFLAVEFKGSLTSPTTDGTYAAVKFKSFLSESNNIDFTNCNFINVRYAALGDATASTKNVKFTNSYFSGLYKVSKLGDNSSTAVGWKFTNCTFASIANRAIDVQSGCAGMISIGNYYADVGNNFAGSGSPVANVLYFGSDGNYSIGDIFDRNDTDDAVYARINYNNYKNIGIQSKTGVVLNTAIIGTGGKVTLEDNTPTATSTGITLVNPCVMNYNITRGSLTRYGTITFANDGTGANYSDNYVEGTTTTGATLYVNSSNVVTYTTTGTGTAATLKYNINYFN